MNLSIFKVIIAVRITNLVMGKISDEEKIQIQTFQDIGFRYWTIITIFPEKDWKLSSAKAICLSFFIS